jgi:hypothetical protein
MTGSAQVTESEPESPAGNPPRGARTRLRAALIGGGVLLVLAAGAVTAFPVGSAAHAPAVPVAKFLNDLEAGKAREALALAHTPVTPADVLLTDSVYAHVKDRVAGFSMLRTQTSGDGAVVEARVRQSNGTSDVRFRLTRVGTDLLVFPRWAMRPMTLGRATAQLDAPADAKATVAGIPVPAQEGRVTLEALPGDYPADIEATPYYTGQTGISVVIGFARTTSTTADVEADLTAAGHASATQAVDAFVAACVASASPAPPGCPIGLSNVSDFANWSNVVWTLVSSPTIVVGNAWESDGDPEETGWMVDTTVPGSAQFSADATDPDGSNPVTVTLDGPETVQVGGTIIDVTATGASYVPPPDGS